MRRRERLHLLLFVLPLQRFPLQRSLQQRYQWIQTMPTLLD